MSRPKIGWLQINLKMDIKQHAIAGYLNEGNSYGPAIFIQQILRKFNSSWLDTIIYWPL